jgi:hypothetical protein
MPRHFWDTTFDVRRVSCAAQPRNPQAVPHECVTGGNHGQNGEDGVQDAGEGKRNAEQIVEEREEEVLANDPPRKKRKLDGLRHLPRITPTKAPGSTAQANLRFR